MKEILDGLSRTVEARGVKRIGELVGARASFWAGLERTAAETYAAEPDALRAVQTLNASRSAAKTT